jgi:putative transcriptional regulator
MIYDSYIVALINCMMEKEIFNRIGEVLKEKELTQTWLAVELDKSFNMVNSYVANRRQPSIKVLYRIAELLEVDAKELLIDIED